MGLTQLICILVFTVSVSRGVPWPEPSPIVLNIPENPPADNSNYDNLSEGTCVEAPKCKKGQTEMFRDVFRADGTVTAKCCTSGSKQEFLARKEATQCVNSGCNPSETGLCEYLERTVNGNQLEYEEGLRDQCLVDGNKYNIAMCCPKGSKDALESSAGAAENHEVPYFVHIKLGDHQCGGTIYDKRHIITAGHCLKDFKTNPQDLVVSVGSNINGLPNEERDYNGQKVYLNEKYDMQGSRNDIAILKLSKDITFGPNVKALRMAPAGFDHMKYGDSALATGMGLADNTLANSMLFKANMKLRSDDTCYVRRGAAWSVWRNDGDMFICAGGVWDGTYSPIAAQGDSGSPLVCRTESGEPVLCGVTSSADDVYNCVLNKTKSCKPTTYMEVQYFADWIASTTKSKQDSATLFKSPLYGAPVADDMYTHQVHITTPEGKPCGGTLIADDTVVTAAQCVTNAAGSALPNGDITVTSGVSDLTTNMGMTHTVRGVKVLNGFHRQGTPVDVASQGNRVQMTDNYYINDLAVIKLNEPAEISTSKLPSLASSRDNFKDGANELSFARNTTRSAKLMQREFRQVDKKECQKRYNALTYLGKNIQISGNVLCGVETYSGGSQCDRELGGGLICKGRGGKDVLCGVQMFRLCEFALPNGFLDVASNAKWIQDAMSSL